MTPRVQRWVVFAYFLALVVLGLTVFRDYGVSWDEPRQRLIGGVSVGYVLQHAAPSRPLPASVPDKPLATFDDRDYGVAFEAPAVTMELLLGLTDSRDVYLMRHLLTYLVFLGGVFAVYQMGTRRFDDWRLGLCAASMLVLSPRFFAEAFYNSKDVVFMACFAMATNTMLAFVTKPGVRTASLHALVTAVAVDVRVAAVLLVPMTLGLSAVETIRRERPPVREVVLAALFLGVVTAFVVLFFPWLWEDPIGRFTTVVRSMSSFQRFSERVRYMGGSIMPDDLPWHYIPVWVAISTPLPYVFLSLAGALATLVTFARRHVRLWVDEGEMQDMVFLSLACAPPILVMITDAVLYDGWRHLYFIYPSLLLLALRGLVSLWRLTQSVRPARYALVIATIMHVVVVAAWMIRAHPMQNVYFNVLAGSEWRRTYEVDYWGLGNRAAFEYLLSRDRSRTFTVRPESFTDLGQGLLLLRPADRARVRIVDKAQPARYVLTNYRNADVDAADSSSDRRLFYRLVVDGEVILSVYETLEN
ncbi:MAG TPA: hypothetical protein VKB50_13110 [Vicinamibacterales bacterium]|nr:hypothetical protein [Vicinamibacterales bacterium]